MTKTYEKTEDPNIVKEIESVEADIHLDKLQKEINDLKTEISSLPEPKTKPDEETLEFWNEMNVNPLKVEAEGRLQEKEDLMDIITHLKGKIIG